MKRIAIVNQRYGLEINGGSEQHARMIAERLAAMPEYDVEVLTTCARDYITWKNHYPEGVREINKVWVRRFPVERPRNRTFFNMITRLTFYLNPFFHIRGERWVNAQGPYCPKCIEYIKKNRDNYDVFIFVTYLYYLTVRGIMQVGDKSILIPTAHDELQIRLGIYRDVFGSPGAIAYNTQEERDFLNSMFDISHIPGDILGVGVDIPAAASPDRFRKKFNVENDYLLYAGRIDEGKNCGELFDYFIRYKAQHPSGLKLVLMGSSEIMAIPEHPDIVHLGFVSDEDKVDGMAGALLFVLPSIYESLSMVVLESFSLGIPVVVNGKCRVLRAHCEKSGAGLCYSGFDEFAHCINHLLCDNEEYRHMQENAKLYVKQYYRWDAVMDKLIKLIELVQ